MKKFLLLILAVVLMSAFVLSASSCEALLGSSQSNDSQGTPDDEKTPGDSEHAHLYRVQNTDSKYLKSAATCTKRAEYFYSCECGEKSITTFTYGNPASHNYKDGKCTVCGADDPDYNTSHTHTFVDGKCTVCGADDPDYNASHTHTFVDGKCTGCGADDPDYNAPHTHTFVDGKCTGCGETSYSDGLAYTLSGDRKYYTVTGVGSFKGSDLVIPSEHQGLPVEVIGEKAFANKSSITSVTIPESIKEIQARAFSGCSNLEAIYYNAKHAKVTYSSAVTMWYDSGKNSGVDLVIGSEVSYIADCLFLDFTKLKSVRFEENDNEMTIYGAFGGCTGIVDFYIPSIEWLCGVNLGSRFANPMYFADNVYVGDEILTELVFPSDITAIGKYTFVGCPVNNVVIPEGVKTIGVSAFESAKMTSLTLPDSLELIGDNAFYYCESLKSLSIPQGVTEIKNHAFDYCTGLTEIYFNADGLKDIYQDGLPTDHFNNVGTGSDGVVLTIGKDVTRVPRYLLGSSSKIVSVKFETGSICERIEDYAFDQIDVLVDVELPISLKSIGICAFRLTGITDIAIPSSVTEIGQSAFSQCDKLKGLSIGTGVVTIGSYAFENCTSLTAITIPGNVKTVGQKAFIGCTGITSLTVTEGVQTIASDAFKDLTGLKTLYLPKSVTSLPYASFYSCTSLTDVYYAGTKDDFEDNGLKSAFNSSVTFHYN